MMKKLIILVLLSATARAQHPLTLKHCIETALANNPTVSQAALKARDNEIQLQQAHLNKLPVVNASIGHGMNVHKALERALTLERQVRAFNDSFRAAEIRFNRGVGNSIDYLTAKNNMDRANINLISTQYEVVLRAKILAFYRGEDLW